MNLRQTDALISLASRFLERASSYLEQAEAGVPREELQESTQQLERIINQAESGEDRYYELAVKVLHQVEEIRAILAEAGFCDERLASIVAVARNSAELIGAVRRSRNTDRQLMA